MDKMIEKLARDIHEATRRASKILVEETRAFVKENHHYHSKNDFDKAHTKTLAELEAEYLTEQGYRKQVQGEWVKHSICGVPCDDFYRCKDCGYLALKPTRYCGNCGAKMKGAE